MNVGQAAKPIDEGAGAVKPSRHHPTRILLALAALVALGWGGWFVWLVAVELKTEVRLRSWTPGLPVSTLFDHRSSRRLADAIEELTNTSIQFRSVPSESEHRPVSVSKVMTPEGFTHSHDQLRVVPCVAGIEDLAESIASDVGADTTWYIEGDYIVITTADKAPAFDASAKAREWWHKLADWWSGP